MGEILFKYDKFSRSHGFDFSIAKSTPGNEQPCLLVEGLLTSALQSLFERYRVRYFDSCFSLSIDRNGKLFLLDFASPSKFFGKFGSLRKSVEFQGNKKLSLVVDNDKSLPLECTSSFPSLGTSMSSWISSWLFSKPSFVASAEYVLSLIPLISLLLPEISLAVSNFLTSLSSRASVTVSFRLCALLVPFLSKLLASLTWLSISVAARRLLLNGITSLFRLFRPRRTAIWESFSVISTLGKQQGSSITKIWR